MWQSKTTKTKAQKSRFSICVHEASHAVMSHFLGFKVKKIVIREKGEYVIGWTYLDVPKCPVLDAMVTLAGSLGESLWQDRVLGEISQGDFHDMRKRNISGLGMGILLKPIMRILKKQKKNIYRVAKVLNKTSTLTGKEFLELIK